MPTFTPVEHDPFIEPADDSFDTRWGDTSSGFGDRWGNTPDNLSGRWGGLPSNTVRRESSNPGRTIRQVQANQHTGDVITDFLGKLVDYYKTPGDILQGKFTHEPNTPGVWSEQDQEAQNRGADQLIKRADGMALEALGMGTPFVERGAAGVFGGKLAGNANKPALARAEEMVANGASRDEVLWQTGWYQGQDAKWRYEIPDDKAKLRYSGEMKDWTLGNLLDHPQLFEAYPDLKNFRVSTNPKMDGAYFDPSASAIVIGTKDGPPELGSLLHEIQHGIQRTEGFSRGTNLEREMESLRTQPWWKPVSRAREYAKNYRPALDNYFNTPGEREAYGVTDRMKMTPNERNVIPPWVTDEELGSFWKNYNKKPEPTPAGAEQSIRAYHGSRRDFDAFDRSKTTKGLYFDTDPAYARRYGKLYEANIRAEPEHFLDLDKPLSQQSGHVKEAVAKLGVDHAPEMGAQELYVILSQQPNNGVPQGVFGAQDQLRQAGILGARSESTFIPFDEKLVDILRKYGLAGLSVLPPALAEQARQQFVPVDHDPFAE